MRPNLNRETLNQLIHLSVNEELSLRLRKAIRREIDGDEAVAVKRETVR